jgi:hypothetical protein
VHPVPAMSEHFVAALTLAPHPIRNFLLDSDPELKVLDPNSDPKLDFFFNKYHPKIS